MNNEFIVGFIKSAIAKGFTEDEAIEIYKQSSDEDKSSWIGRYTATKNLRTSNNANHPFTGLLHKHETNKANIDQAAEDSSKGYGDNAKRFAGAGAQVGATFGAPIGAMMGMGHEIEHGTGGSTKALLLKALVGVLGGGAIGVAGGAGLGALGGLAHKHQYNKTNHPSREDAKERFKQHPIRQSLMPFGDAIASIGSSNQ